MKTHHALRLIALTGLGTLASLSAMGQSTSYYYGGISAGQAQEKINGTQMNNSAMSPGLSTTSLSHDGHDLGYKIFGGYQFNPIMGLEWGYFNLGRFSYRANTSPLGTIDGRADIQGVNLDLVGTLPLMGKLSALGRVGAQYAQTKDRFDATGAASVVNATARKRELNYKLGLGLQYEVSPALLIRTEIERYRLNDGFDNHGAAHLISLSLVFPFGRNNTSAYHASTAAPYEAPQASAAPMVYEAPAAGVVVVAPPTIVAPPSKRVTFSAESLFGFDKTSIRPEGQAALDTLAKEAVATKVDTIKVEGYTDRIGSSDYNQRLSEQRAEAVKAYLVQSGGLDPSKIIVAGKGEALPVTTPEECKGHKDSKRLRACLQADRRVEIELSGTTTSQ